MGPKRPELKKHGFFTPNDNRLKKRDYYRKYEQFKKKWPQMRQANLFTIDYSPNIPDVGETTDTFIAETTFTALDWMILDYSHSNADF